MISIFHQNCRQNSGKQCYDTRISANSSLTFFLLGRTVIAVRIIFQCVRFMSSFEKANFFRCLLTDSISLVLLRPEERADPPGHRCRPRPQPTPPPLRPLSNSGGALALSLLINRAMFRGQSLFLIGINKHKK